MSASIVLSTQPKKPFHYRNGSDELDVFEAAGYFSGASEDFRGTHENTSGKSNTNFTNNAHKYNGMRPIRRMSLDMTNHMDENPMMVSQEKKFKQPSSPGAKLAHFLNSLFNQTSSKKSKSKSKSKKKSTKDEDESPGGWKRKRRSSMSHLTHFSSGTTTAATTTVGTPTTTVIKDDKVSFSTSKNSGFRTPPPYHVASTLTKTTSYIHPISYTYLNPPPRQITKIPITDNLNKIKNFNIKCAFPEKNMSFRNGFVEKVKILDAKQEEHHPFKKFNDDDDDDGADSDSSSDLFELKNCDLGYYSSGLPVCKTTRMDSIKSEERCTNVNISV